MKKILVIVLALAMLFTMSALAEDVPHYVIGFAEANLSNEANSVSVTVAEEYCASFTDKKVELRVIDANGNGPDQVAACETFISDGVDCVIVNPVDANVAQAGVEMCIEAGVKVIVCKCTIEDQSIATYVGQDDVIAGEIEMEYIAERLGGKGNIVIIEGPTGHSAANNRNDGIYNVLEKYPDIKVLYTQPGDWQRELGMSLTETWLQTGEQIDAIVAHNDEMALGAYDALADAGMNGKVLVIGIDAIAAALDSVSAGEMDATVLQDHKGISVAAIDTAIAYIEGAELEDYYWIDPILVTKDNVADYV